MPKSRICTKCGQTLPEKEETNVEGLSVHSRDKTHTVTQYRTLVGVLSEGAAVCVLVYTENCAVKIQDFTTGIVGWLG